MVVMVKHWVCDECCTSHDTEEQAKQCEKSCLKALRDEEEDEND